TAICANMRSGVPATHLAREAVHRLEPLPRTPTADRVGAVREPNVEDQAELIVADVEHGWTDVLQHLESRVEPKTFDTVVRRLQPVLLTDREIRLLAPTRFSLTYVTDNLLDQLRDALTEVVGGRQIVLDLSPEGQGELFPTES